jgi:diacylglycerol kinase (ATP)
MHNKPDFHIFKNIGYALAGMRFTFAHEKSFRTQVLVIALIGIGLIFTPLSSISKWILFASTWPVLIAEAFNSAIERVVDLVTQEHHPLAGQAKDIGAFGVLLAFCLTAMIWGIVIYSEMVGG